jgi:hypothetical protein
MLAMTRRVCQGVGFTENGALLDHSLQNSHKNSVTCALGINVFAPNIRLRRRQHLVAIALRLASVVDRHKRIYFRHVGHRTRQQTVRYLACEGVVSGEVFAFEAQVVCISPSQGVEVHPPVLIAYIGLETTQAVHILFRSLFSWGRTYFVGRLRIQPGASGVVQQDQEDLNRE